jgi:4-diphosphocytidyl-2-C-methyl-D-erythritol kinase
LVLKSYAKLNLYLRILGLRKDRFHNIETIFERIDLCDKITLKNLPGKKIKILSGQAGLPTGRANLAWRAAKLLQDTLRLNKGVEITIHKRIPMGAGLGGGSSNAASVLLGLKRLWKLKLGREKLAQLAAQIGSDAPFFIYQAKFALGLGRGEKIEPLKGLDKICLWHILAVPKIRVPTPRIYRQWDRIKAKKAGLTSKPADVKILTSALRRKEIPLISRGLRNDLEPVTLRLYPAVRQAKTRLAQLGLQAIQMSGSGSTVFGMATSRKEARALAGKLRKQVPFWQVLVVRTV